MEQLTEEIGRLCREYAVCCVEVERREEANGLKRRVRELCGLGRESMDIRKPGMLVALMDAYEVTRDEGMLQEVLDVVSGHWDGLAPSLEAVKLLAYCYYYVEEEECALRAKEMLQILKVEGEDEEEWEVVENIVEEFTGEGLK